MKIPGWTKVDVPEKQDAIKTFHKWRRDRDNAFLEIDMAQQWGFREGYVALLWADKSPRPRGLAGGLTLKETYDKSIQYMFNHP